MNEKSVYFTVDFENMTQIARDEWCGLNLDWALDLLDSLGLSRKWANKLLLGEIRLVDDPDAPPGTSSIPVADDWEPDPADCAGGVFIDPCGYQVGTESIYRQGMRIIKTSKSYIIDAINRYANETYSIEKTRIARELFDNYPKQLWKDCGIPYAITRNENLYSGRLEFWLDLEVVDDFIDPEFVYVSVIEDRPGYSMLGDVDAFIKRQLELDVKGMPDPCNIEDSPNGIIARDGLYYPCEAMEHNWLLGLMIEELEEPESSFVLCSTSKMTGDRYIHMEHGYEPTEEQEYSILSWAQVHNADQLPLWFNE